LYEIKIHSNTVIMKSHATNNYEIGEHIGTSHGTEFHDL